MMTFPQFRIQHKELAHVRAFIRATSSDKAWDKYVTLYFKNATLKPAREQYEITQETPVSL